jgi:peroxiredoxin
MHEETETLAAGARAPEFSLKAANREDEFTLRSLVQNGNLILEFLRGTW